MRLSASVGPLVAPLVSNAPASGVGSTPSQSGSRHRHKGRTPTKVAHRDVQGLLAEAGGNRMQEGPTTGEQPVKADPEKPETRPPRFSRVPSVSTENTDNTRTRSCASLSAFVR